MMTSANEITTGQMTRLLESWNDGDGPLYELLARAIRNLVSTGRLPAGARLPSERALSARLIVSRNTIAAAFDILRADGVLSSKWGDGTYVSAGRRHLGVRGDDRLASFATSPVAQGSMIDLRSAALGGLPFVADIVGDLAPADLHDLIDSHGYAPLGLLSLREGIAQYYTDVGLPTHCDQIIVTSGAQQALRLVIESLFDPGSTVLVEDPSFRGAIEALRMYGVRLIPVPSGPQGVNMVALEQAATQVKPTLIMVQSTVNNPSGSVLTDSRRQALAALSEAHSIPILDDCAPSDTLIDVACPRPVAAFGGQVFTLGSMSKAFWGGLRIGWLRADRSVVERIASIKMGEDLGTSLLAQVVAERLLPHIDRAREERRLQLGPVRDRLVDMISTMIPTWSPTVPMGGASLWVKLPCPCAPGFAQFAEAAGVRILPGPTFSCNNGLDDCLRVAYAQPPEQVEAGMRILAAAWQDFVRRPHKHRQEERPLG